MKNYIEMTLGLNKMVCLQCLDDGCKHNLDLKCNLKNISINGNSKCCNREDKDNKVMENMFPNREQK